MKVKICGLTTQEAVTAAVESGADFIGFIFAESKRQISPEKVAEMTINVPETVKKVGVFVSPTEAQLLETIHKAHLDMVQIHGEMPEMTSFPVPIIRAASVQAGQLPASLARETFDYLLLDAPPKEYHGGNGETFDWSQVDVKQLKGKKIFVAGGLSAANVRQAADYFHPYAVDVSSGVETEGKKDIGKICCFLQAAKEK